MLKSFESKSIKSVVVSAIIHLVMVFGAAGSYAADSMTSQPFTGARVNGGTVTLTKDEVKTVLTLSDDFVVPGTPDPPLAGRGFERTRPSDSRCTRKTLVKRYRGAAYTESFPAVKSSY